MRETATCRQNFIKFWYVSFFVKSTLFLFTFNEIRKTYTVPEALNGEIELHNSNSQTLNNIPAVLICFDGLLNGSPEGFFHLRISILSGLTMTHMTH